jgi:hypothetical protein
MVSPPGALSQEIQRAIQALDLDQTRQKYWEQNECVALERFLQPEVMTEYLIPEVEHLRPDVHRTYISRHKKGGSISSYTLAEKTSVFLELYRSPAFTDFLSRLVGARLVPCPDHDPHAVPFTSIVSHRSRRSHRGHESAAPWPTCLRGKPG